ncbi:acetyl-CoA synthetase-like protein [Basidiobolus meristosporus CBS 931.73]|uniref:Acetyl-CoA synthetase-like protein n=1 Tax=Basidiobolus meristosporus CBS 931.73 TaxID=1314790 RepID=A0A1Y1Z726_9FUNG|nr:acetyl-CoA synthetase-like protein [Basidiobolus meristosporus CBS 931.73]|eukprot:ORY05615.1 acetyl-CoA synthetase-like protein [Basidiobolus meristosporus CBS 931.73]
MSLSCHSNYISTGSVNLLETLRDVSAKYPAHGMYYINNSVDIANPTFSSYPSLLAQAYAIGERLRPLAEGMSKRVVVLYFDDHQDTIEHYWGCLAAEFVPCVLGALRGDDDKRSEQLSHLDTLLGKPLFLCRQKDHSELTSLLCDIHIQTVEDLGRTLDEVAVLLLTSGSTGNSKAVELTHGNIFAAAKFKIEDYNLGSDSTVLNWVGCDHVAGLVESHIIPMVAGANQVQVAASVITLEPLSLLLVAEVYEATSTFAPNFLLANIEKDLRGKLEDSVTGQPLYNLAKLKRINSGGEANLVDLGQQLIRTLTEANTGFTGIIAPGFGMTETCAGCVYNKQFPFNDNGKEFATLGSPSHGLRLRIVDGEGRQVPPELSGDLEIFCPQLFRGYYNNAEATAQAFTSDGWFRTGDTASLADGRLHLVGRTKDTIILRGVNYYSHELEAVLQDVPGIVPSFVAVCPIRPKGSQTEQVAVFYLPTFPLSDEKAMLSTHSSIRQKLIMSCSQAPTVICPLTASLLAKNSLGKLSRGKLRERYEMGEFEEYLSIVEQVTQAEKARSHKSPSTDSERALSSFLCDIFNATEVCVEENFFSMGGSSLEVNWPVIRIMQHPTIRELAEHLDTLQSGTGPAECYDPVVPLQVTGSGVPIFFVHPGVGEVLIFVNLAKYFANERPFYALRARGFDNNPYFESMEEMADMYTAAIRKTQPQGPYAVAGYSYGGVVAFEIAKRLEAQGQRVAFVGLVNIPPHIKPRMLELDWTEGFLNLSYFLDLITKEEATRVSPYLHTLPREEQINHIWTKASPDRIKELEIDRIQLEKWVDIAESLLKCGRNYEPSGTVEHVSVFYAIPLAGKKEDWLNGMLMKWDGFTRQANSYIDVPGAHYTLMNHHYVPYFQKHLKAELKKAGI